MDKEEGIKTDFVRDSDGCVYKVESSDNQGVYLSAEETDTFRVSMDDFLDEFEATEKEKS